MGREQLVDWVRDHLVYVESEGALSLALGLNAGAVAALLELGQRPGFANAPLFLADVVLGSELELTTPQVNELVDQLATHAQAATNGAQTPTRTRRSPSKIAAMLDATSRQETVHSPAWPFIRRLSQMSLAPGEAFDTRTRAIAGTQLSTDLQTVAAALVAVGRAHDEGRPLTSNEVHAVQAALDLPLPPPPEAVYETRRRIRIGDGKPAIAGLPTLARRAIAYLGQLEARSAEAIYDLGQASTAYQADRIGRELVLAGVDIVPWERKPRWRKAMASLWEGVADARDEEIVMKDIAAISDIAVELGRDDRWSLASIANLLAASGYAETTFGEFRAALRHDTEDLRIRWFQALAKAYGIDPVLSAAQARHILASADLKDMWQMITTRPATEVQIRKNVALPKEDQEVLVDCLTAASSWIAWSAAEILANNPFPGASQRLLALLSTNRQRWDRMIAMVAAVVADDPDAAAVALASAPESAYRAGAADSLIVRNVSTGTGRELLVRLAADDDLTVRSATHGKRKSAEIVAPEAAATYWSCSWCGHINMLTDSDCVACELASIPELNPNTLS